MKTNYILFFLFHIAMSPSLCQVSLTKIDAKDDQFIVKYTDQYSSLISLDSLFSLKAGNFCQIVYYNKSTCGHHEQILFWLVRYDTNTLECVKYQGKANFARTRDKMIITRFRELVRRTGNDYLFQENKKVSKCNLDEIIIKENQELRSCAIGDGGFVFSGDGKIPSVWFELINETSMLPSSGSSIKGKRGRMTNRKFLKSFSK